MADVAVVGAGVAGASVAFALARRGADVVVIDDARTGRATPAGAGIIAPWATKLDGDVYDVYADGAEAYPRLVDELADVGVTDIGYARNGALMVSDDAAVVADVVARITERTARSAVAGAPELVDGSASRALFPPLADGWNGVYVPGGARVDGRRLAAGLLEGVRNLGGTVVVGAAVATTTHSSMGVEVDGRMIDADTVVIAAGAWVNDAIAPIGSTVAIEPQRGQICHLHLDEVDTGSWPSLLPMRDHYIVPFDAGRVVVGATREPGVGFDPRLTALGVASVLSDALDVAPGLADATLIEMRVGLRPYPTAGDRPVIGRLDDRTWLVGGFGAIGLTLSPTVGFRVAAMISDGGHDELLAGFAPD